jgi:hypothetical protein
VGLHQQVEGLKRDGPSAFATRAVRGGIVVGTCYLGRLRNYPSTPRTYSTNAEHPTDVSRRELGGAVTINRQVERMVRTLDVKAAQVHMRRIRATLSLRRLQRLTAGCTRAMKTR